MNNMLFACSGMRQGRHHLYDEQEPLASVAQASFKQTIHRRIQESFGGTQSKAKNVPAEFDDDIRDEDFDDE